MPRTRGSYPYPVLDRSDDVDSEFAMSKTRMASFTGHMELEFDVTLTDEDLRDHLRAGTADLVVRWRCPRTFKLGQITPKRIQNLPRATRYSISLAQDDIDGRVDFELQIVATTRIPYYRLSRQNQDYRDATFAIEPGSVLGVGGVLTIQARKLYDPMQPPLESCFEFKEDDQLRSGIQLAYENPNHVMVWIASATFRDFAALRLRPDFQIATVMLPALMATLTYMKHEVQSGDDLEDYAWHRALTNLLKQHKVEEEPVIVQAQTILENPIGRAVEKESAELDEDNNP
jgi:hypothetical protein